MCLLKHPSPTLPCPQALTCTPGPHYPPLPLVQRLLAIVAVATYYRRVSQSSSEMENMVKKLRGANEPTSILERLEVAETEAARSYAVGNHVII